MESKYIPVIGLEIHLQLNLQNKMFSPEKFEYGAPNNTLTTPITLAYPGTLPTFNKEALYSAIKLGLSFGSDISNINYFDRKTYFYPDLPKGYQITQDKTPICKGGRIYFDVNGKEEYINLTRIHVEEDTANIKIIKSGNSNIYNNNGDKITLDYNRCGAALLEIVTKPEFKNSDEVFYFLHELRRIVRFLKISNCNMEEGSLRCDVNVSLTQGNSKAGQNRVEVKNLNSIKNVKTAIEYEIIRQSEILNNNNQIKNETRTFVPENNTTKFMRLKENSSDYRYTREFNIPPIVISDNEINNIKNNLETLPREYKKKLMSEYNLSEYISDIFLENLDMLHYFETLAKTITNYETLANWLIGPIKKLLNKYKIEINELNIDKNNLCELITLVIDNKISYSTATQIVLEKLIENPLKPTQELIKELNLTQDLETNYIKSMINNVLTEYSNKVVEYKNGKKGILGLFVGEVMKRTKNKANPKITSELIQKAIEENY